MTKKLLPPIVKATDVEIGDYIIVHTTLWPVGTIDIIGQQSGLSYTSIANAEEDGQTVQWIQFFTPDGILALAAQLSDKFTRTYKSYYGSSVYHWSA